MEKLKGYINIFKNDNILQTGCGIYETETKAFESGRLVKGYISTIPIMVSVPEVKEEVSNE